MFSPNRALISDQHQTVIVAIKSQRSYYIYYHTTPHHTTPHSQKNTQIPFTTPPKITLPSHLPSILFHHSLPSFYFTLPHILYLPLRPAQHSTPFTSPHLTQVPPFKPNKPPPLPTQPATSPNIALVPQHSTLKPKLHPCITHQLSTLLALVFHLSFPTITISRHRFHPNIVYYRQRPL